MAWFNQIGPESDVVVSSRVRFARNLEGFPFPAKCSDAQRSELIGEITHALLPAEMTTLDPAALSPSKLRALMEKHYISPEFVTDTRPRALLLDEKLQTAVMICEEDHLRIQAISAGFALSEAYQAASRLDTLLDEGTKVAYSEALGYLTHCPTNLGTAMRASVMLHLPALKLAGRIPGLVRSLTKLGITVRGIYGEGSDSAGALYQVSNSVTLGFTEDEILEKLDGVVRKLIESERKLRDSMKSDSYARLCDKVMRSKGILTNAYMLDEGEFMELWSDVYLGAALGILEGMELSSLTSLMVDAKNAPLSVNCGVGDDTPESELAILRAKYVREHLH